MFLDREINKAAVHSATIGADCPAPPVGSSSVGATDSGTKKASTAINPTAQYHQVAIAPSTAAIALRKFMVLTPSKSVVVTAQWPF